ncbi:hypothetical protein CR973_02935 [Candidatus Saccharibacteria bacterium]|nr:MAG: hypothetical protein CR973_02935 [Candidatus Saccharibacteria bacterium]
MVSLKNKKGFTIVELLIVIVVIGILATLVIVTFTGMQQKARNTQRQTDINAIQSHVEAFYAQNGFYPSIGDLTSSAVRSAQMKGLDPEALLDPKQSTGTISGTAVAANTYQYSYVASASSGTCVTDAQADADNPADTGCDTYVLTAHLEGGSDYVKQSN